MRGGVSRASLVGSSRMDLFARSSRDAVALDDGRVARTFAQLDARVAALRGAFEALALSPGDHVAMLTENRSEGVELVLAFLASGLVFTPLSQHASADETAYVLADSGARVLFHDAALSDRVPAGVRAVDYEALERLVGSSPPRPVDLGGRPGGAMIYTSGTSGRPKGVRRALPPSVGAMLDLFRTAGRSFGFDGSGPHLVTGPLYHAAPLMFALYDMLNGAPVYVMRRWDERAFLTWVRERGVRHTHLVPTMIVRLLRLSQEERDSTPLESLTLVMHGAAPITPETKRAAIDWLGDRLVEYWGATEGGIYTLVRADEWLARPGTVGRPIAAFTVYAESDAGERLPAGEVGTLVTRHATLSQPFVYHGDETKTAGCYRGAHAFTVGDLGHVDVDGYVYLSERRTNLILSGGVNLYPAEIERVLLLHPDVADVAVFGVPDPEWGERVHAAVQLVAGAVPTDTLRDAILEHTRSHLAKVKIPRSLDFHAALPRTEAGKMRVRELRARYVPNGP